MDVYADDCWVPWEDSFFVLRPIGFFQMNKFNSKTPRRLEEKGVKQPSESDSNPSLCVGTCQTLLVDVALDI
jgi:hypothetical protein